MKRLIVGILILLSSPAAFSQYGVIQNWCQQGGRKVIVQGMMSSTMVQRSIPRCTVSVYLTGTTTLATIYSDGNGTALSNPFTANSDGSWLFFTLTSTGYDVVMSGGVSPNTFSQPFTLTDVYPGAASSGGSTTTACTNNCTFTGTTTFTGPTIVDGTITSESAIWSPGSLSGSGLNTLALTPTVTPTGVVSATGGSLAAGTYCAKVAAVDGSGNATAASSETCVTTTGSTSSIAWSWSSIINAYGYQLYVGTSSGGESAYFTSSTTSYTQTVTPATPLSTRNNGYWHTSGGQILDSNGNLVRIAGTNWYGFETTDEVAHGLYNKDYKVLLNTIKNLGFNVIRLPFSNQMVESPIVPSAVVFVDADGNTINSDLMGLNSLQIMDKIISYAGSLNLRVILDNHRSEAGDSAESNGLWYTSSYSQSQWIADWVTMVNRYQGYTTALGDPVVVGADLRNEPHDATSGGSCWTGDTGATVAGCPTTDTANNWPVAATLAGNAVLAVNSNWLIFVEGTDFYDGSGDWWGGNLMGVASYPITLNTSNRVVYSAHEYGPALYAQSWFTSSTTYSSLAAVWDKYWGYIQRTSVAPVWIGEFGTDNSLIDVVNTQQGSQGQWFSDLIQYFQANPAIGWTYYALNGDDSYATLDYNYDAVPPSPAKEQLLNAIMEPCTTSGCTSTANGYLGTPPTTDTTGGLNFAGPMFLNGLLTTNSNIIAKQGRFASGIISNGIITANQGINSKITSTWDGNLILSAKGTAGVPAGTASTTGGTVAAGSYYAKVVVLDDVGNTTTAGTESSSVTTTGTTGSITWSWTAVAGAKGYRVYVGTTAGGESSYFTTTGTSLTQTTTAGTTGTVPTRNTTGNITAPGGITISTLSAGCAQFSSGGVLSSTGTACGAGTSSMTWPSAAGIAVYSGSSAWGTSLTAPTGSIAGTGQDNDFSVWQTFAAGLGSAGIKNTSISTAGVLVAASDGTESSSGKSLVGSGAAIPTGPSTSVSGDLVAFTGTSGQLYDTGILASSLISSASPTFTGTVTVTGSVAASGNIQAATFAGTGTPTLTAGATTVTGTSPSIAVYGSGVSGEIDMTVGTSTSAAGTILKITFPTTYPSAPKAIVIPDGMSNPTGFAWTTTTTTLTLTCTGTLTAGGWFKWIYILIA